MIKFINFKKAEIKMLGKREVYNGASLVIDIYCYNIIGELDIPIYLHYQCIEDGVTIKTETFQPSSYSFSLPISRDCTTLTTDDVLKTRTIAVSAEFANGYLAVDTFDFNIMRI